MKDPFKAEGRDNNPAPEEPEPGDEIEVYRGPKDAWDTVWETLACDVVSAAFDPELREELRQAVAKITETIEQTLGRES